MVRAHVYVSGRVQGVGYRDATLAEAKRAGARGWVRNLEDGRVEAVFEGERAAVEGCVGWCAIGPAAAHVKDVEVVWGEREEAFTGFERRATASATR